MVALSALTGMIGDLFGITGAVTLMNVLSVTFGLIGKACSRRGFPGACRGVPDLAD